MHVFGQTGTKEMYLVSKENPFVMNEYLMVEDKNHGTLPVEVIATVGLPKGTDKTLPLGADVKYLKALNIDLEDEIFIAKVTLLKPLRMPVTPASGVRKATFNEIEDILIQGKPDNAFTLGVIEGTYDIQDQLPDFLNNISPGWEKGRAVAQVGVPFLLNFRKFREYPHIGIFGTTGSGKTFGMRVIEEELMKFSIPTLSFDPHQESVFDEEMPGLTEEQKTNYKDKYEIFYIGKDIGVPFSELNLGELVHLFEYVGALTEPQKAAMEVLYERGDTLAYLRQKITDLKIAFEEKEKKKHEREKLTHSQEQMLSDFGNKVSGASTLQALSWKLDSLENTEVFNGDVLGVEKALKKRKMAVIRGDIRRLQMISSYVIKKFYKQRRNYQDARERGEASDVSYFPMFFVVMDEAHNFAPKHDFNPTKQILRTIALEARKYGVFLTMVTQKPDALDEAIVAQLNTKIIYRLKTASEMEMAQKETGLTEEEVEKLPSMLSGSCYVSSPILAKTFAVRFRTTFTVSPNTTDPFDELDSFSPAQGDKEAIDYLVQHLPIDSIGMSKLHSSLNKDLNKRLSVSDITALLEDMVQSGHCEKERTPFGIQYK